MSFYEKTIHESLSELGSSENGLPTSEAAECLRIYGPNTIRMRGTPLWRKLIEPFANVFMIVLIIAVIISLVQGAVFDGIIIAVIISISATIYYIQQFSTDRILRALQKHQAQSVLVTRDNRPEMIDASKLVPGDIFTLTEGERVPADARIVHAHLLRVNESQLTGESEPITKNTEPIGGSKEVYEQSCMLFQGSFITQGECTAVVTSTGNMTEYGKLASLSSAPTDKSPIQEKIDKLISVIIGVVAAVAVVIFILVSMRGMELGESLRFVIALSVSAVPESLPVAITIVLVLAMRRMAAKKALVRSQRAIETIGAITTIATDKTGTLTKNKLAVIDTWKLAHTQHFNDIIASTILYKSGTTHDPLDTALYEYAKANHASMGRHTPMAILPFDQAVSMSGNLWHHGSAYRLFIKGAPEHVLHASDVTEYEREQATAQLHKMAASGLRVIAIAYAHLSEPIDNIASLPTHAKLTFVGFVGVADTLRPDAKHSIQLAQRAGVTVRMITGDHFETAYHIGKQLGLVESRDQVFDARQIHTLSDAELRAAIEHIRVFSRVVPEHKYRILEILRANNITAMTGDGVNDVPALTNANVGIAMGSGSDIAKDAGDIILLGDNFKGIVEAMFEGRTVLANIRRMLFYLLSTSTGEVLTTMGALIIGVPVPISPVQILWVNLVTDSAMVIPLGLEPGERSNLSEKPKPTDAPILSKFMISRMVLLASTMALTVLQLYTYFLGLYGQAYASTIAFSALVVMQWSSALCARSNYAPLIRRLGVFNGKFYLGLTVAISVQMLALFSPLGAFLHITPVALGDLAASGIVAFFAPILVVELHKLIGRTFFGKGIAPSAPIQ